MEAGAGLRAEAAARAGGTAGGTAGAAARAGLRLEAAGEEVVAAFKYTTLTVMNI